MSAPACFFSKPYVYNGVSPLTINCRGWAWLCYFLSLYLPVFLCYVGMQCFDRYQNNHRKKQTIQTLAKSSLSPRKRSDSKKASLSDDVWLPSIEIISIIGIYIMIFSILSGMLMRLSLFRTPICTFLLANLEITTGIHLLAVSDIYSLKAMYALSAMPASFWMGYVLWRRYRSVISRYRSVFEKICSNKNSNCSFFRPAMFYSYLILFYCRFR